MESFYHILTTFIFVICVFVFAYAPAAIGDLWEKRYRRSKFKVSYMSAFSGNNNPIAFKDVQSLALKSKVTNSQAVIALDELRAEIVENKNESISKIELDKVQAKFRVNSSFGKIPESLRGHLDKLKLIIPEDNSDLFRLEEEIQDIAIRKKAYKLFSLSMAVVTIAGTVYTILGYFKI